MRRLRICTALLPLLTAGALAGADTATEVLERANDATQAIDAVAYHVTVEAVRSNNRTPIIEADVKLARVPDGDGYRARVEGEVHRPGKEAEPVLMITDGKRIGRTVAQTKTFHHGELPNATTLLGRAGMALVKEFVREQPFGDELRGDSKLQGEQTVDGVPCYVVVVSYKDLPQESHWYIGKRDFLPRRVERLTAVASRRIITLSALNPKASFDSDTFAVKAPDGYKSQVFTPPSARDTQEKNADDAAPDFTLKTPEDEEVTLSDLRGKVVVLDFWATWCGPCKLAMPEVQDLHERFKDKPVKVFGVNVWERKNKAAVQYMKDHDYTYGLLLDGDAVARKYNVRGIPTFYVIGKDGKIIHRAVGFGPNKGDQIAAVIEKALKE